MTDILKDIEGAAVATVDIRTKLIIGLGAALALAGLFAWGANHFEDKGRQLERAGWLAKEVAEKQADIALERKHAADMAALKDHYEAIGRTTSENHENELAQLRLERDADRRRADAAGGLRILAPACPAGGTVAATEAAGTSGRHEAGTRSIRLPQQVENDLWAIADDADEVSAQLRACQSWIRANGFYGKEPTGSGQLLDRMIAAPTQPAEEPTQ